MLVDDSINIKGNSSIHSKDRMPSFVGISAFLIPSESEKKIATTTTGEIFCNVLEPSTAFPPSIQPQGRADKLRVNQTLTVRIPPYS
ncbi:hypothetical protein Nepgr_001753 [Nepenthes gracilis]|uniref:Uncharacterized protein n=1 Tax=Nepenthes gracilis TaxID=150966 RepID=A0AAD3RX87_NEPGR|nr:hypothetical protein Nepgr_001753 [Nepenthes gracilis]